MVHTQLSNSFRVIAEYIVAEFGAKEKGLISIGSKPGCPFKPNSKIIFTVKWG
jgi:hypothetical protein